MLSEDRAASGDADEARRIFRLPLIACAAALPLCAAGGFQNLTAFFLRNQDVWLLLCAAVIALVASLGIAPREHGWVASRWRPAALALGLLCLCYVGHYWLLSGYALSRDEQMALFDADIFSGGRLAAPLPLIWVPHAGALNTLFMLPVEHPSAWVSSYLPMNAALHAVVGLFADPALTGPLLVGIGALALHGCTRTLWPDRPEASPVALLLYALSGQVLMTGMTSYAMSAHLALNLVWLWLFLQRRGLADMAALAIGFVAVGLHQPIFHPLFAAPILGLLLSERAWRRAALFAIGYAAICVFWLLWPGWMLQLVAGPQSVTATHGVDYLSRLLDTVRQGDAARLANMIANLLRFVAWQPILLLPLVAMARPAIRRGGIPAALAWGVALPVAVMLVILPYQGHGFGYRYLHGVIGNLILLAVYGWFELGARLPVWRTALLRATIGSALILLPLQAWMAHRFYATYADISEAIARSGADYAVIGGDDAAFTLDLVINRADLSNRPIRLIAEKVDARLMRDICRPGTTVALVDDALLAGIPALFGRAGEHKAAARNQRLARALTRAGCLVNLLR